MIIDDYVRFQGNITSYSEQHCSSITMKITKKVCSVPVEVFLPDKIKTYINN